MEHILPFSAEYDLLPQEGLMIVALSGGGDSVALLHFLKTHGFHVVAAHFNHHLRPTARRDAEFCRDLCQDWKVPFFTRGARVADMPGNTEENARNARYAYFDHLAAGLSAARIVTAHTANDNAETVLMHLTRGCGLKGLIGIQPRRGKLARPMLHTTRRSVEEYLARNHLSYITDETNFDTRYVRNRLRHQVIPVLESVNPKFLEAITRMTQTLGQDEALLEELSKGGGADPEHPALVYRRPKEQEAPTVWKLELSEVPVAPDAPPAPDMFYLAKEGLHLPLTTRFRQPGDYLHPPFRTGKTVKKWMNELKVPQIDRDTTPILVDGAGKLLSVAGIGPDQEFLAKPGEFGILVRWIKI